MESAILVTPIWQESLDEVAEGFLTISQRSNEQLPSVFLAPSNLNLAYYRARFPSTRILTFDSRHFGSVAAYSTWMVTPEPYEAIASSMSGGGGGSPALMVLCQTDAVLVRSLLDDPLNTLLDEVDYLGSPWDPPVRVLATRSRLVVASATGRSDTRFIEGLARIAGKRLRVGNGGLSIRRIDVFINLARRLQADLAPRIIEHCYEDVLYCTYGPAAGLRIASHDLAQSIFQEREVIGREVLPPAYGFHALQRWNPTLARQLLNARD